MPIILSEDNITLNKKTTNNLKSKVAVMDSIVDDNDSIRRDMPGLKIAKHTIGTNYRTDKEKKSGEISTKEAERIINHAKYDKNQKSTFNQIFDPNVMTDIKSKLNQKRTSVKETLPIKPNSQMTVKPPTPKINSVGEVKPSSIGESSQKTKNVVLTENQLKKIIYTLINNKK